MFNTIYKTNMTLRSSKELILATKKYTIENRKKSWFETLLTIGIIFCLFFLLLIVEMIAIKIIIGIFLGIFYVRMFVIYHDYQHHAILQKSKIATIIMRCYGIFMLTPENIWKRSHDHHHAHNSKLVLNGIGSYPTITKKRFLALSKTEQNLYLINRHPITILLAYFTLFIYWLNVKSFWQSPQKHPDSFVSLLLHFTTGGLLWYFLGFGTFMVIWFLPFFVAFAMGAYLFYCQHNFPGAEFAENHDWQYDKAALRSTSYMKMSKVLQWATANIGFHHVHHLNSRIPFYNLPWAMEEMPELQNPPITTWSPVEIYNCFKLKLWDGENSKMIRMNEL